ncbi:inactive ubiquitin carboxyl-terminal hydrolase MINDY-4B isoform X5 [Cryptotermes secundus]|uniref:inactive ubiquitin carboxyl-terminal hydrolase MINDY-4B isoform X5 n=1 Tax=Cryptotermes secundus TaxID=105785 RepID=UPI000CD7B6D5|nr:inactive ubiquitin carboxyl-terminal hydrolase MINDY-4B isoform X5 [Cryptotermes secundus]
MHSYQLQELIKFRQRVIYPRNARVMSQRNPVIGGTPITEELAAELRQVVFGCSVSAPKHEWLRTGLVFRDSDQELGYGLKSPRNGTRGLLSVVQGHIIKHLLFEKRGKDQHPRPDMMLKPSRIRQIEALWTAIADILWRIGEKSKCSVVLPQDLVHVPHSHKYLQDGITEKLNIFEFTDLEDLQIFIKRHIYIFEDDPGPGALLVLYSAILTRGTHKVKTDMDNEKAFLMAGAEEGSHCIVTLLLTGRATPYLHNGVVYVGDEDHYAMPQFGILSRSEVGFLVWDECPDGKVEESRQPGSRLKTPSLPVWVSLCAGHYGVLFNTNRELLRNYHAERRFDLHYYTCGGSHSLLTVDTRYNEDEVCGKQAGREDFSTAPPLEKLIHTKWEDAHVRWTGQAPVA